MPIEQNSRFDTKVAQSTFISVASSKPRNETISRESINIHSLVPEGLVDESRNLITFFEKYYEWLNQEYYTTTENENDKAKRLFTSKNLFASKVPDNYTVDQSDEIRLFFEEFAKTIPINTSVDFRIVLKNIMTLYNQKGSTESIQSFFRIIYNIASSVYYPWDDVLIASDGEWDGEKFISNKGFLSDKIHLQDSKYWQRFSYDIKIGEQESKWRDIFEALIHPAGFEFFASFLLVLSAPKKFMSAVDSFINDGQIGIVFKILLYEFEKIRASHLETFIYYKSDSFYDTFSARNTFAKFAFLNECPMYFFDPQTIEDLSINNKNLNISSFISQTE
jgi:hypothetical protein